MAKKFVGTVKSDVQDKTRVVIITRRVTHPVYGKRYIVSKNFQVHDEAGQSKKGDRVEIIETRPISKTKAFKLVRVLEASHGEITLKDETETVAPAQSKKVEDTV